MHETNIKVYFSISGDEFDPSHITKILNIKPTCTWKKGDLIPEHPNIRRTKVFNRSYNNWEIGTNYQISYDVNEQFNRLLSKLDSKVPVLLKVKKKYPKIDYRFMVVINIENKQTPATYVTKEMISFCHKCGAVIDFDIYA